MLCCASSGSRWSHRAPSGAASRSEAGSGAEQGAAALVADHGPFLGDLLQDELVLDAVALDVLATVDEDEPLCRFLRPHVYGQPELRDLVCPRGRCGRTISGGAGPRCSQGRLWLRERSGRMGW